MANPNTSTMKKKPAPVTGKPDRWWVKRVIHQIPYPSDHSKTEDIELFAQFVKSKGPTDEEKGGHSRYEQHIIRNFGRDACRKAKFMVKKSKQGESPSVEIISTEIDMLSAQRREFWIALGIFVALTAPTISILLPALLEALPGFFEALGRAIKGRR